jgi:hypothetical protein
MSTSLSIISNGVFPLSLFLRSFSSSINTKKRFCQGSQKLANFPQIKAANLPHGTAKSPFFIVSITPTVTDKNIPNFYPE